MRPDFAVLGALLDPHAAFLVQRGLKTYFVRYREQTRSAQTIAEHLAAHPAVSKVHYPGLPGHPQAALAKKQMREAGTVVSFDLQAGRRGGAATSAKSSSCSRSPRASAPPNRWSWRRSSSARRDFTPEQARQSGIAPGTVRLSIGLEDVGDLIADIDQALGGAGHQKS